MGDRPGTCHANEFYSIQRNRCGADRGHSILGGEGDIAALAEIRAEQIGDGDFANLDVEIPVLLVGATDAESIELSMPEGGSGERWPP